ncbi:chromate transporter [Bosea sp. OAE752]|uniref:chromate efflux transporter n=1 Tax=Bosea sp. OAE752 TaxID=2663873 RepID=UPI003D21ECEB
MTTLQSDMAAGPAERMPTLAEATRVWAKIGCLSFGGPAGQIALMHRELVEERRWIGEERFLHALNYCMLLPGPEAQQLAIYIGWLMHRTLGGLIAGLLFILPGALVMLGLSALYVTWRHVPLVDGLFFGIKAAVLAIVIEAGFRISRRALKTPAMRLVALAAFLALFLFKTPFPLVILAAAFVGWAGHRLAPNLFSTAQRHAALGPPVTGLVDELFARGELTHTQPSPGRALRVLALWLPLWLAPVGLLWLMTGTGSVWTQIGSFFSMMAVVTFGGAYAVLSYVAQAAVEGFGWLAPGEMLDGLGLAETTPGPLVLVLQFVGFLAGFRMPGMLPPLLAGSLGAVLTLWATFAPCFLWIFLGAPYIEALRSNESLSAALAAITAAVVGVIANLALWFGLHVLFRELRSLDLVWLSPDVPVLSSLDWQAALLAAGAILAILRFRIGMMPVLAACGAAGIALKGLG